MYILNAYSLALRRVAQASLGVASIAVFRHNLAQAEALQTDPIKQSTLSQNIRSQVGKQVTINLEGGCEITGTLDVNDMQEVSLKDAYFNGKPVPLVSQLFRCQTDLSDIDLTEVFIESVGEPNTKSHMFYYRYPTEDGSKLISPWHDIPLWVEKDKYVNFICEIPKYSRKKWEIATNLKMNPIKQDIRKDGYLREYEHGDMLFNYGALPQTWESPHHKFEQQYKGDNDPLDALEIGVQKMEIGQVKAVKVLGVYAMIDDGEIDYKLIVIRKDDPFAEKLNSIQDIERVFPGVLIDIQNWLKIYKVKEGKGENKFGWASEAYGPKMAFNVIRQTHHYWKREFMLKTKKVLKEKQASKARMKLRELSD